MLFRSPMRPNVKYTVLISTDVATAAGVTLANNYTWTFVTGVLNLIVPPMQQPGSAQVGIAQFNIHIPHLTRWIASRAQVPS